MKQFMLGLLIIALSVSIAGLSLAEESRSIGLHGVGNARELGGYSVSGGRTVKHGVFLRTAALHGATSADISRLQDDYHLSVVADLRLTLERNAAPDPEIPGAKNIHLPIFDEKAMMEIQQKYIEEHGVKINLSDKIETLKLAVNSGILTDHLYIDLLSGSQGKESYGRMFREILALPEGKSFLFHCTQGKDRTGIAAMLILSALGANEDTIMADYMLTNAFNAKLIESEREMLTARGISGDDLDRFMKAMDEVDPQYMINALNWLKENYSSVTGYITKELGVTEEQLDTLRARFLE